MSPTAVKTLVGSSKATVLVLVVGLYIVAMKTLTPEQVESLRQLLVWLVPGWMVAHAGEKGAKALANGKAAISVPSFAVLDTTDALSAETVTETTDA